ncbi:MAG: hypothetical protein FJX23_05860 [Alphaproteobacteria bacterium]|nr:hypothetical protein [Alphaproteobacteria bacterium]
MEKLLGLVGVLCCLAGCSALADSGSWRYRMTVNVETPEGMKSGSAVRQVTVERAAIYFPERGPTPRVKGEAVVVDLGDRGQVFALLKGYRLGVDHAGMLPFTVFPLPGQMGSGGGTTKAGVAYYSQLKDVKGDVPQDYYPMFVHFKDPQDPTIVELVMDIGKEPEQSEYKLRSDRFEEIYGKGVKLHSVVLEMTDDPVTTGIEKWLPWLPQYKNKLFDGRTTHTIKAENRLANSLGAGAFSAYTLGEEK